MSKVQLLVAAIAASTITLPVLAGGPPFPYPAWKQALPSAESTAPTTDVAQPAASAQPLSDFQYIGGDAGWQLRQHHYIVVNGRFEHASDCDHAMRTAARPASDDLGGDRYPGA